MGRLCRSLALLLLTAALLAPIASAAEGQAVSLGQAVEMVRERSGGRVLAAETVRQGEREEHRIRVLVREGQVRVYRVDAQTGHIR